MRGFPFLGSLPRVVEPNAANILEAIARNGATAIMRSTRSGRWKSWNCKTIPRPAIALAAIDSCTFGEIV